MKIVTQPMTFRISRTVLNDIIEALGQAQEYFEPRMDADGDPNGGFIPNEEMQLYSLCERALEELPSLAPIPAKPKDDYVTVANPVNPRVS